VTSKVCKDCLEEKELSGFYNQKGCKFGVANICKLCTGARAKAWRLQNPEKYKKQREKHYRKNKKRLNLISKKYYEDNKERLQSINRDWKKLNKDSVASSVRLRKKKVRSATPSWLTKEHKQEIQQFYWLAQDLKTVTGESYHVDHIVPLKGENVCGLHVPWNLQVLPADINLSKGNKYGNFT